MFRKGSEETSPAMVSIRKPLNKTSPCILAVHTLFHFILILVHFSLAEGDQTGELFVFHLKEEETDPSGSEAGGKFWSHCILGQQQLNSH